MSQFARFVSCPLRRRVLAIAALALCAVPVRPAAAQWIPEIAGGWSYRPAAPNGNGLPQLGDHYALGFNARLSVGRRIADHIILRLDAFANQSSETDTASFGGAGGCIAASGCSDVWSVNRLTKGVAGLTMNAILELDPRGIFYAIGGTGIDDAHGTTATDAFGHGTATYNEMRLGASLGAGVALPIGARLRAILEARAHRVIGATAGPQWFAPISVGLRY